MLDASLLSTLRSHLPTAFPQLALPPGSHFSGTTCQRGLTPDGEHESRCSVCGIAFPCASCYAVDGHRDGCRKSERQLPSDLQASIRSYYWSLVAAAGLRTYGTTRLAGRLELEVGSSSRDHCSAIRYPDHSIRMGREIRDALLAWHADPTSATFAPGSPADAHLTLIHETVHCCGSSRGSLESALLTRLGNHVDELVTELCARQILADQLGLRASEIFGSHAHPGAYDALILPTAWAVGWACDCSDGEAIDRLAWAALRLRSDTPVSDELTALGQLVELATSAGGQ